jgi:hypothetical protein
MRLLNYTLVHNSIISRFEKIEDSLPFIETFEDQIQRTKLCREFVLDDFYPRSYITISRKRKTLKVEGRLNSNFL